MSGYRITTAANAKWRTMVCILFLFIMFVINYLLCIHFCARTFVCTWQDAQSKNDSRYYD